MPQLGDITEIYSTPKSKTWIWKVGNFFSLPKDSGYVVGSPSFYFSGNSPIGSTWRLLLFPNGTHDLLGHTKLMLSVSAKYMNTVHWELGIKRQDGTFLKRTCGVRSYQGDQYSEDKSLIIAYETLKKALCWSPNGTVTILCRLYNEKETMVDASCQTEAISRTEKLVNDLKVLLDSGDNSDVTIRVKGREFRTHSAILTGRVPVFNCMFKHNMTEKTSGIVDIDDCEANIFQIFLQYIYTGTVEKLTLENVCGLYEVSDKYQVDELKEYCLDFMKNNLSIDTFCDIVAVAWRHGEQELTEMATNLLSENMKDVITTEKWQIFLSDNPIESNELLLRALKLQK